jgi:hypothetical protein
MKVTADTITDGQVRQLQREAAISDDDKRLALLPAWLVKTRQAARERCAAAWNARHGGES